jgi:predicted DNA-binding protein (UPF0251 family)
MTLLTPLDKDDLARAVRAALKAWDSTGSAGGDLLDELLFVQEKRAALADPTSPSSRRLAANQVLLDAIEELAIQDAEAARVLRLRFADNNTLLMAGYKMNVSEYTVSRLQRSAIDKLTEIIFEREQSRRQARAERLEAGLPPASYTRLFGLEDARNRLLDQLLTVDRPWVIAIAGIGGIGKTALADAVTRRVIGRQRFEDVAWLRVEPQTMSGRALDQQQAFADLVNGLAGKLGVGDAASSSEATLGQVRRKLKASAVLAVIDNLETDAETAFILNHLQDLAEPSKFLLTARSRPAQAASVHTFSVDELSNTDSLALLRHHGRDIGVATLDDATDAELDAIFDVTGGNPLALKLVVSLLDVLPLSTILEGLRRRRPGPIEDLYRYIYRQTWQTLSAGGRQLLQAMPLVAEAGGTPDYLQAISGLQESDLWPALQELRNRSLLEVRGTIQEKRYGIHRLTETFLQTEINKWEE